MECAEVKEEFSALLDGELTPEERTAVEAHLSLCSDCLRELDGLKRVDLRYRQLAPLKAPQGFEDRVRGSLRHRVIHLPVARFPRVRWWPMLASVAGFLAVVGFLAWQDRLPSGSRFEMAREEAKPQSIPAAASMNELEAGRDAGAPSADGARSRNVNGGQEFFLKAPAEAPQPALAAEDGAVQSVAQTTTGQERPQVAAKPEAPIVTEERDAAALPFSKDLAAEEKKEISVGRSSLADRQTGSVDRKRVSESPAKGIGPVPLATAPPRNEPLPEIALKSRHDLPAGSGTVSEEEVSDNQFTSDAIRGGVVAAPATPPAAEAEIALSDVAPFCKGSQNVQELPLQMGATGSEKMTETPITNGSYGTPQPARGRDKVMLEGFETPGLVAGSAEKPGMLETTGASLPASPAPAPPARPVPQSSTMSTASKAAQTHIGGALGQVVRTHIGSTLGQAAPPAVKQVGQRVFELRAGAWFQKDYPTEQSLSLTVLRRGSNTLNSLLAKHSDLAGILAALDGPVIVRLDATWYRIEPAPIPK